MAPWEASLPGSLLAGSGIDGTLIKSGWFQKLYWQKTKLDKDTGNPVASLIRILSNNKKNLCCSVLRIMYGTYSTSHLGPIKSIAFHLSQIVFKIMPLASHFICLHNRIGIAGTDTINFHM